MATFTDYPPMYDFDKTDEFLQSLSGAVPNFSSPSIDGEDKLLKTNFLEPNAMQMNYISENFANPTYTEEVMPNTSNFSTTSSFSNPQFNRGYSQSFPQPDQEVYTEEINLLAPNTSNNSPMSTNSTSHFSANGFTPVSQNSISSDYTSPETIPPKEELDTKQKIKHENTPKTKINQSTSVSSTNSGSKVSKPSGKKDRCSHNMIEKKYRTNINSKILALRDAVPALRIATGDNKDVSIADLEGLSPASKLNKASVLTKATEYIQHLEKKNDILKRQNMELQALIQRANCGNLNNTQPQIISQVPPQAPQAPQAPPQQTTYPTNGFGYAPPMNEQAYNTTVNRHPSNFAGNGGNYGYGAPEAPGLTNGQKVLLGGLATVMGTSLFSGNDGDFKGLSALPLPSFLSKALLQPSPLSLQLFQFVRIVVLVSAIVNIVYPSLIQHVVAKEDMKNSKENSIIGTWKDYFFVYLGLQLPRKVPQTKKDEIAKSLIGVSRVSYVKLFHDYCYLSSSHMDFENCLLVLIIGKLLTTKYPFLSSFFDFNMTTKACLLPNLEYKGDNASLAKLGELFGKLDGISVFGSDLIFRRLINVIENKPIIDGCANAANNMTYVEFYQDQQNNFYGILLAWRLLELSEELNTTYLSAVSALDTDETEEAKKVTDEIFNSVEVISGILKGYSFTKLVKYFKLFKAAIDPESAYELREFIQNDINSRLQHFKVDTEIQELTDTASIYSDEYLSDSSERDDEDETGETTSIDESMEESSDVSDESLTTSQTEEAKTTKASESKLEDIADTISDKRQSLLSQSSLINSLNLVSQEEFVVLTCTLVSYYHRRDVELSKKLLKHLSLISSSSNLTLLSFTAILNVIIAFDADCLDHDSTLDKLIVIARVWITEAAKKDFLEAETRNDLSNLVINKGILMNGFKEVDEDL